MPDFRIGKLKGRLCVVWDNSTIAGGRRRYLLQATARKEAEAEASDLIRALSPPPTNPTVQALWKAYREAKEGRPIAVTMGYTGKAVLPHFGHLRSDQVGDAECKAYAEHRRAQAIKDGSIWTELGHLRTVFGWAARPGKDRLIAEAPEVVRPAKPAPKDRWLTREEIAKLLPAATVPHVKLAIVLMLSTAGRVGSILDLTWDRVDFENGVINLRVDSEGPRKGRAVPPMNRMARSALLVAHEAALSDYVIEWGGEPVKCILKGVKSAAAAAGLAGVSPHVLRHTAAVHMVAGGIPISKVAQYLGHSNSAVTERVYGRYAPEHLKDAAEILEFGGLSVVK